MNGLRWNLLRKSWPGTPQMHLSTRMCKFDNRDNARFLWVSHSCSAPLFGKSSTRNSFFSVCTSSTEMAGTPRVSFPRLLPMYIGGHTVSALTHLSWSSRDTSRTRARRGTKPCGTFQTYPLFCRPFGNVSGDCDCDVPLFCLMCARSSRAWRVSWYSVICATSSASL